MNSFHLGRNIYWCFGFVGGLAFVRKHLLFGPSLMRQFIALIFLFIASVAFAAPPNIIVMLAERGT